MPPKGFVKARGWGNQMIPVEETSPTQRNATTATPTATVPNQPATPVAGAVQVPEIPSVPTNGPSNILEYAGAIEARQEALDRRIRQLVGWFSEILFELEGYLPENQTPENAQKPTQNTEKEGETSIKLPKKGEKAESTSMSGVVKPAAGSLEGPSDDAMEDELRELLSEGESPNTGESDERNSPKEDLDDKQLPSEPISPKGDSP